MRSTGQAKKKRAVVSGEITRLAVREGYIHTPHAPGDELCWAIIRNRNEHHQRPVVHDQRPSRQRG